MTDIRRNFITCLGEETSVASRLTPVQAVGDGRVVGGGGWVDQGCGCSIVRVFKKPALMHFEAEGLQIPVLITVPL